MHEISLIKPDDWHIHLRDNDALALTVAHAERQFNRVIVMPNLQPPIINVDMANAYRKRIMSHVSKNKIFQPLMTLYLTDNTNKKVVQEAHQATDVFAFKLYPAGATTHSSKGVQNLEKLYPTLSELELLDIPLLIHGEVTNPNVDIFDREKVFIDTQLAPLIKRFPNLRIVLEHITTKDAVQFINDSSDNIAATITAHHLLYDRNAMFVGGIKPHYYCLPILKRREHKEALITAATSASRKFFLGTDSAPHTISTKENKCGCAGIYTAHAALELYAEVFEKANRLENLEQFASINGANFYGLPINKNKIILQKKPQHIVESFSYKNETLSPLRAGKSINWTIIDG